MDHSGDYGYHYEEGEEEELGELLEIERSKCKKGQLLYLVVCLSPDGEQFSKWLTEDVVSEAAPSLIAKYNAAKQVKQAQPKKTTKPVPKIRPTPSAAAANAEPPNSPHFSTANPFYECAPYSAKGQILYEPRHLMQELRTNAALRNTLQLAPDQDLQQLTIKPIMGGYINHAFSVTNRLTGHVQFVKLQLNSFAQALISAEVESCERFQQIVGQYGIRMPKILGTGQLTAPWTGMSTPGVFMVQQFVEFEPLSRELSLKFARKLATVHLNCLSPNKMFGFDISNYSMFYPQDNTWEEDWLTFFLRRRFIVELQRLKSLVFEAHFEVYLLGAKLADRMALLFQDLDSSTLKPSLLHGDMCGKNVALQKTTGDTYMFDVVPFYGHNEMDLIGFSGDQLAEYHKIIPEAPLEGLRRDLYSLFDDLHHLIHTHMKPGRFHSNALRCLHRLLAFTEQNHPPVLYPFGQVIPLNKAVSPKNINKAEENIVIMFQGSFSPIHLNHISVLDSARDYLRDKMNKTVVATYLSCGSDRFVGRKLRGKNFPHGYRVALTLLMAESTTHSVLLEHMDYPEDKISIERSYRLDLGWSVTVYYLCGADRIHSTITRTPPDSKVIIVRRNGYDEELETQLARLTDEQKLRLIVIRDWTGPDLSSTKLRAALETGGALSTFVPPNVENFIVQNNLRRFIV